MGQQVRNWNTRIVTSAEFDGWVEASVGKYEQLHDIEWSSDYKIQALKDALEWGAMIEIDVEDPPIPITSLAEYKAYEVRTGQRLNADMYAREAEHRGVNFYEQVEYFLMGGATFTVHDTEIRLRVGIPVLPPGKTVMIVLAIASSGINTFYDRYEGVANVIDHEGVIWLEGAIH